FLKADLEEAQVVSGEADPLDAARSLFALGPRLVCVTLGAEGAVYCCDAGVGHVAAPKVDAVDTTGAGDAFSATVLAGLLRHDLAAWGSLDRDDVAHLVRRACVAGARVCRHPGATAGLPSSRDLDEAQALR
ncbi:MAG: carbohydrate kinase, partial [Deltaproteobacteria bacterium]|nr:carbohydrate kinase [Deltaproteobacteria bacterium]